MSKWPMVPLGEVLTKSTAQVEIAPHETFSEVTVRLWGKGVDLRRKVTGAEIKADRRFIVSPGQFIVSRIDARNGAFGLIPDVLAGAIVSNDFPVFNANAKRLAPSFLNWLSKTSTFVDLCRRASEGTTNRVRLKENLFLQMEIPLPPISEQKKIVDWIDDVAKRVEKANYEAESAIKRLENLLMSAFYDLSEGAPRRAMKDVAPLIRRQAAIDPAADYPELGVRCFGKGTFQKPSLSGLDVGTKKLYAIEPGDLIFSNVFAWEGAIAVAKDEDKGRYGSHRFITCVPNSGVANAVFLNFYFQTPVGIEQIRDASPGGAGRNRTLGLNKLEKIMVPVPRYELQVWFDQLYEKVEMAKRMMTQAGEERNAILPSVLNQVFSGEEAK